MLERWLEDSHFRKSYAIPFSWLIAFLESTWNIIPEHYRFLSSSFILVFQSSIQWNIFDSLRGPKMRAKMLDMQFSANFPLICKQRKHPCTKSLPRNREIVRCTIFTLCRLPDLGSCQKMLIICLVSRAR